MLEATGVEFEWDWQDAGVDVYEKEGTPLPDRVIESIKSTKVAIKGPISMFGTERIVRSGFEYAKKHDRKKITLVHKANIMKFTDGLFLEVGRRIAAEEYPVDGKVALITGGGIGIGPGKAIARGIEKRAIKTQVPRRWNLVKWSRGWLGPQDDFYLRSNSKLREAIAEANTPAAER